MAKFSDQFIQGILNPSYSQGLFEAAKGVGATPGIMMAEKNRVAAQGEVQKLLQQYANDPAQLTAMSQKYAAGGQPEVAKLFAEAANRATISATASVENRVSGDQSPQRLRQAAKEIRAAANGDSAMLQRAAALETKADAMQKGQAGLRTVQAGSEYSKLKNKPKDPSQYDFSEETIVIDGVATRVKVATNKNDPSDIIQTIIGTAVPTGGGTPNKSLKQMMEESGVDTTEFDLDTIEGLTKARAYVIGNLQNAALANTITGMIEDKTPPGVLDAFTILRDVDPAWARGEEDLDRFDRFTALSSLGDEDVSGLRDLIEKTVSTATESDVKAIAALNSFKSNKDFINKVTDFGLGITSGRLSADTLKEYTQIMTALQDLAKRKQLNTLNRLIINGSPREEQAAEKAKGFIMGTSTAQVISQ